MTESTNFLNKKDKEITKKFLPSDKQPSGYGIVRTAVLEHPDLTIHAKALYSYLASLTGNKFYCWPSQKYISDNFGMSLTTIKKSLVNLEKAGIITKDKLNENSADNSNKYIMNNISNELVDMAVDNFDNIEVIRGQQPSNDPLGTKEEKQDSRPRAGKRPFQQPSNDPLYNKELNNNNRTTTDSERGLSVFLKSLSDPKPENISEAYCHLQKEKGVKIDSMKGYAKGIQKNIESGERDIEDLKSKIQEHVDNKQSVTKQHQSWAIQTEHQKKDRLEISKQQSKDSEMYEDIDNFTPSEFERLENIAKQNIQPKQFFGDMYPKFLRAEMLRIYKAEFKEKYSLPVNQGNITYIESASRNKNLKEVSMV